MDAHLCRLVVCFVATSNVMDEAGMSNTPKDFGPVERLDADAEGPPGQRVFRLLVASRVGSAALELEKEELRALGVAIDQLLARVSGQPEWKYYGRAPEPYQPAPALPSPTVVDFKIGQLSLGYETETDMFIILAHNSEDDPEGPPTFSCLATASQVRSLSRRIESVIAAGRPTCPLCGDPLEAEGHACVRAN